MVLEASDLTDTLSVASYFERHTSQLIDDQRESKCHKQTHAQNKEDAHERDSDRYHDRVADQFEEVFG